jgi:hypothetical protein
VIIGERSIVSLTSTSGALSFILALFLFAGLLVAAGLHLKLFSEEAIVDAVESAVGCVRALLQKQ